MSSPLFTEMGRSRERRLLAQRRRRRRRAFLAAAAVTVVVVAVLLGVAFVGGNSEPRGAQRASSHHTAAAPPAKLSADGLPLATPAVALSGLSSPLLDPVHLAFARPPRSGLLFNLEDRPGAVAARPAREGAHRQPHQDDDGAADREELHAR